MFTRTDVGSGAQSPCSARPRSDCSARRRIRSAGRSSIRGRTFSVVGVTESTIEDQAEPCLFPYTALQALGIQHISTPSPSRLRQAGETSRIAAEVARLLRERHRIGNGDGSRIAGVPDDFTIKTEAARR